jgi:hypothetical protein
VIGSDYYFRKAFHKFPCLNPKWKINPARPKKKCGVSGCPLSLHFVRVFPDLQIARNNYPVLLFSERAHPSFIGRIGSKPVFEMDDLMIGLD